MPWRIEIPRHLPQHRDVVAERRPRIPVLDELLPGSRERLSAREPRRVRDDVREAGRPDGHEHDRLARTGPSAGVDDAQPGLKIIDALLRGQHAQKPDQAVDGREPGGDLPAHDDATRVRHQPRKVEAHLSENDALEHDEIKSIRSSMLVGKRVRHTVASPGWVPDGARSIPS